MTTHLVTPATAHRHLLAAAFLAVGSAAYVLVSGVLAVGVPPEEPAARRLARAQEFHLRAQQRTGLLVPLYVYPGRLERNEAYRRLIEAKRRYETLPMWVIVNPASGPGERTDPNYTRAIDRLRGAGCVVLGYVSTSYGRRPRQDVQQDIDRWLEFYPRVHGIFFDEMIYEDDDQAVEYQAGLSRYAHERGCWPTVANPGADTPARYFAQEAADVIVIHEGPNWPAEARLAGGAAGGYADHPPHTRAVLVHSQAELNKEALRMVRQHARWIYVTEGVYRPNDPTAANPWGRLSGHLEAMCQALLVE